MISLTKAQQSALLTLLSLVGVGATEYANQPTSIKITSIIVATIFSIFHIHSPATGSSTKPPTQGA